MNIAINHALKSLVLNNLDFSLVRCQKQQLESDLPEFFRRVVPKATEHALIRIGNGNDGGYLLPDDVDGVHTCFSPGVSDMADFELAIAKRGIRSFLADYSVDSPPVSDPLIAFEKKFLGGEDTAIFTTLATWLGRNSDPADNEMLLQMDIEGGEYDVLIDTPLEVLKRFRIIVVEFHSLEALFTPLGFRLINGVFMKLLRAFTLVHAHPNNCFQWQHYGRFQVPTVMEFTFHRSDRIARTAPASQFPHPLDRANMPANPDFALPRCWYSAD